MQEETMRDIDTGIYPEDARVLTFCLSACGMIAS
jgi:hypothetical protein